MAEIKPSQKNSPLKFIFGVVVILLLLLGVYKIVVNYQRKSQLDKVMISLSDSIDIDFHDQAYVASFFQNVKDYNRIAYHLWMEKGFNPRVSSKPNNPDEIFTTGILKQVLNQERKLKESLILKNIGLQNEDIQMIQDLNITPGVLIEAKELNSYTNLLKDRNIGTGSRPEDIWVVQKLLNYNGYKIPIDGIFNEITDGALTSFQKKANLFVSHRVDNYTLFKLTEK